MANWILCYACGFPKTGKNIRSVFVCFRFPCCFHPQIPFFACVFPEKQDPDALGKSDSYYLSLIVFSIYCVVRPVKRGFITLKDYANRDEGIISL